MWTEVGFTGVSAKPARVSAPPLTPPPLLGSPPLVLPPSRLTMPTHLALGPLRRCGPPPCGPPRLAVAPRGYGLQTVRRHQLRGRLSWLK